MKYLLIFTLIFLVACTTTTTISPKTIETEPCVLEKTFNITLYREERTPHGEPRCEQMPYNVSKTYSYTEEVIDGKRNAVCTFMVRNDEDMSGTFSFYPNYLKTGKINDGPQITKTLDAFETAKFEWTFELDNGQTANCLLQCQECPHRIKCFFLEPIIYDIKQIPYIVQERRNVSTTCPKQ